MEIRDIIENNSMERTFNYLEPKGMTAEEFSVEMNRLLGEFCDHFVCNLFEIRKPFQQWLQFFNEKYKTDEYNR